jgi:serine/threonine protein kinase
MGCCSSGTAQAYLSARPQTDSSGQPLPFVRQMSNIREHYTVVKCLGTGSFGSTYLVKDKRYGIEKVAKELIKTLINDNIIAQLEIELTGIKELVFRT